LEEGALLAGLTKGPNYFNPDRHPGRAQERLAYVLSHLREDGVSAAEPPGRGLSPLPALVPYERPRRDIGFHFVDQGAREAQSIAGVEAITANSYTARWPSSPPLQRAVEEVCKKGCRVTSAAPGASSSAAPKPIYRRPSNSSKPTRGRPINGRRGSGRSRVQGCHFMTCTGRPLSCWRNRPAQKARRGVLDWPTGGFCRSRSTMRPRRRS